MSLREFSIKIRRRETPFYRCLYRLAKTIRLIRFPVIGPLHRFLYNERKFRLSLWNGFCRIFYYDPMFRSQCAHVGSGLMLIGGIPLIYGNLRIVLGNNVTIHGVSTFVGAKVFDSPTLRVGDNSHLGYQLGITVGYDVTIGKNVLIGNRVNIFSYDQHPIDPAKRHEPAPPKSSKPVTIEDNVWIGANVVVMKGVTIGENSVVASGSVVTTKVPPNSLVIGNPARIFPLII